MKAIILDMYGVIIKDSGDSFYEYINQTFPQLTPSDIYPIWDQADVGKIPSLEVFRQLGYQGDLEKIQQTYLDTLMIDETFYDFAKKMKKDYKLALLSNDSSEWSKYLRTKFEINDYFDVISISGDLKMKKPDERIFRYTAQQLGCKEAECTYIDDRRYNLEAADAVGMNTVLFNSRDVEFDKSKVKSFLELADLLEIK